MGEHVSKASTSQAHMHAYCFRLNVVFQPCVGGCHSLESALVPFEPRLARNETGGRYRRYSGERLAGLYRPSSRRTRDPYIRTLSFVLVHTHTPLFRTPLFRDSPDILVCVMSEANSKMYSLRLEPDSSTVVLLGLVSMILVDPFSAIFSRY